MANYLLINGVANALRLPPNAPVEALRATLEEADETGQSVPVEVLLADTAFGTFTAHVRPQLATWWAIVTTAEPS